MTEFIFRTDAYARMLDAKVTAVTPEGGVVLDRTIFYAASGGQPNDTGRLDGMAVVNAVHPDGDKTQVVHVLAEGSVAPAVGNSVTLEIDWERRYRLMRMHTALHLLSVVFPFPVTGGSIGEDKGRLDFDMPEVPDNLAELEARLNAMVSAHHAVSYEWITDEEMSAIRGSSRR